jgi:DNA-binding FadR family transcriptional regulator
VNEPALAGRVPRLSLPAQVAEKIGKAIVAGGLLPGSALPCELDLTRELGVSRTVLREAFKILGGKGLISSRPKSGTTILPSQNWNTLDVDVLAWRLSGQPTAELINAWFDFRGRFEPLAARLVAQRGNVEAETRIKHALRGMEINRNNLSWSIDCDVELHLTILEFSGNEFLVSLGGALESALRASFLLSDERRGARDAALPLHGNVVAAICSKNPDAAEQRMLELIEASRKDLLWVISAQKPKKRRRT